MPFQHWCEELLQNTLPRPSEISEKSWSTQAKSFMTQSHAESMKKILGAVLDLPAKGQIISECPYEIIVWTKIATKKFPRFLSQPLKRGQIKNFIKPIMLNNP